MTKKKLKQSAKSSSEVKSKPSLVQLRLKQVGLVFCAIFALYILVSLGSFSLADPTFGVWHHGIIHNWGGFVGAWLADALLALLGLSAYAVPFTLAYHVYLRWQEIKVEEGHSRLLSILRFLGWLLILLAMSSLLTLLLRHTSWSFPEGPGGIFGGLGPLLFLPLFNFSGSLIMLLALLAVGLTLFSGKHWLGLLQRQLAGLGRLLVSLFSWRSEPKPKANPDTLPLPRQEPVVTPVAAPEIILHQEEEPVPNKPKPVAPPKPMVTPTLSGAFPSLSLLDPGTPNSQKVAKETLNEMASLVETKLLDFGITAQVTGVFPGPVVTRYELQLAPGMKVARLSNLDKDLARSLSVKSVRIVEVIPGKSVVGIELPNSRRDMVKLHDILDTAAFKEAPSPLTLALGKDIAGEVYVADLAKMPHLLVAGTTGSGKSVGINAMVLSLLFKAGPETLRLIMIDPKMLELSIYEGIPHLLTPVVTDMKEAANALRWCVKEMDQRYRLMAAMQVRNIAGFNEVIRQKQDQGEKINDPLWLQRNPGRLAECPALEPLPYIVVIVDEFADMIMVVGKKVEELITRIAQKARAAGIHLIVATQRPSVDVITGLIKANIPTRIAFQVSSRIDSRTILDQHGAEQLLGNGDMLYLPVGSGVPIRVHGAFVSDQEVQRVVEAWKALGEPNYIDSVVNVSRLDGEEGDEEAADKAEGESDALYDEAVKIVLESKRASISLVQRRLRIGYNRAARLLEDMEKAGLVSELQANGMREVLVK